MTLGELYYKANKYDDVLGENIRLKELYGEQQAIIEAYFKYFNKRNEIQNNPLEK